jgi:hypothetical protein
MSVTERPDSKIPTRNPQPVSGGPAGAVRRLDQVVPECAAVGILSAGAAGAASSAVPGSRAATVTDQGITVYPARCEGGRWRAVWYEPDGSRGQCASP